MYWVLLASTGLASLAAAASPTTTSTCSPTYPARTCPTKTIPNIIANFDDRPVGDKLIGPYHHLHFINLTVADKGHGLSARGIIPASPPHYAIAPPQPTEFATIPRFDIIGTNTTSFDFHSIYFGCLSTNATKGSYSAVACRVNIDCATSLTMEGHYGPTFYDFTPSGPKGQAMTFAQPSDYNYCAYAYFELISSSVGYASTQIVIDSFNYTIREGETGIFAP